MQSENSATYVYNILSEIFQVASLSLPSAAFEIFESFHDNYISTWEFVQIFSFIIDELIEWIRGNWKHGDGENIFKLWWVYEFRIISVTNK